MVADTKSFAKNLAFPLTTSKSDLNLMNWDHILRLNRDLLLAVPEKFYGIIMSHVVGETCSAKMVNLAYHNLQRKVAFGAPALLTPQAPATNSTKHTQKEATLEPQVTPFEKKPSSSIIPLGQPITAQKNISKELQAKRDLFKNRPYTNPNSPVPASKKPAELLPKPQVTPSSKASAQDPVKEPVVKYEHPFDKSAFEEKLLNGFEVLLNVQ